MNLRIWYKGLRIPHFRDKRVMENFAVSMMNAFSITSGNVLNVRPTFALSKDIDTAAINLEATKVLISSKIINPEKSIRSNPSATEEQALTTIFGMIFHESMHFVHTSRNLETIMKSLDIKQENLYFTINNILEDYYIDAEFLKEMPQYSWTYDARYDYFFSYDKAKEKIDEFLAKPTSANMVAVMIAIKNPKARSLLRRLAPQHLSIVRLALSVINENDREKRPLIAHEVYKLLLEDTDASSDEEVSKASDYDGDEIMNVEQINSMVVEKEIDGNQTLLTTEDGPFSELSIEVVPQSGCLLESGRYDPFSEKIFEVDNRYSTFANLLKARSETSRLWTPPEVRGRQIRNISRIATDNKIFSTKVVEQGLGPQEIIILVDCSSSMRNEDNIFEAIRAAYGAALSLENGRHSVAVYGHTADHDATRLFASNVILRFKSFSESAASVKSRFENFYKKTHEYMYNNDDEMAIFEMSRRFTKTRNSKTLIVISDGQPSSLRLRGNASTKAMVEQTRVLGIKIISISITENAEFANDWIYGKEWNVKNDDPNVVIEVIRKIANF